MRVVEPDDPTTGSPIVLCGIEGCPRVTLDGQDAECGLLTLQRKTGRDPGYPPICGAEATLDLWEARGLIDLGDPVWDALAEPEDGAR